MASQSSSAVGPDAGAARVGPPSFEEMMAVAEQAARVADERRGAGRCPSCGELATEPGGWCEHCAEYVE